MGVSEDDPTICENLGLVDNGIVVIGTGLCETLVQLGSGSFAFHFAGSFADVVADVHYSADEVDALASASKSLMFKLVTASMIT
jgi:hypothetical protein